MKSEDIQKFEKAVEHFKHELAALRTGRASAALLDGITVESYGQRVPLSHIAGISVTGTLSLAIQPWDKSNVTAIEKAIQSSNLGLNPINDGTVIRLNIPQMTEERRKEMVKVIGQISEQARVAVRNVREEILKEFKHAEENNQMTKDDVETAKKDLQETVDKFNSQIKEISAAKEKEILTI